MSKRSEATALLLLSYFAWMEDITTLRDDRNQLFGHSSFACRETNKLNRIDENKTKTKQKHSQTIE